MVCMLCCVQWGVCASQAAREGMRVVGVSGHRWAVGGVICAICCDVLTDIIWGEVLIGATRCEKPADVMLVTHRLTDAIQGRVLRGVIWSEVPADVMLVPRCLTDAIRGELPIGAIWSEVPADVVLVAH